MAIKSTTCPKKTLSNKLPNPPARIKLNKHHIMVKGRKVSLTPGMTASGEIVTRQKSVLTFIMEPVTRRFSEAFSVR